MWETKEASEELERHKLRRIYEEVGVGAPPDIEFFEVHNYFAGGRWRG